MRQRGLTLVFESYSNVLQYTYFIAINFIDEPSPRYR